MKVVFVAGPFSAADSDQIARNVELAKDWGLMLAEIGLYPLVPHTMYADYYGKKPEMFWRASVMEMLRRSDALFLIPGWQQSEGSRLERDEAVRNQIPIFACPEGLREIAVWYGQQDPFPQIHVIPQSDAQMAFDQAPNARCDVCGRKSWASMAVIGVMCATQRPDGRPCSGRLRAIKAGT